MVQLLGVRMSKGSGRRPEGAKGDYRGNKFWDRADEKATTKEEAASEDNPAGHSTDKPPELQPAVPADATALVSVNG